MAHPRSTVLLATALALAVSGCGGSIASDKAGGSTAPRVLDVASPYTADEASTPHLRAFVANVQRLSHGTLELRLHFEVEGYNVPDIEERAARDVIHGRYDIGWIPARAWDELGVTSFQALQAPFLVTNYALEDRIVRGPIAEEMLAGLMGTGVVGLALAPELLRHPVSWHHPLVAPSDFAGTRVRVFRSRVSDMLLRALGARPVHIANDAWDAGRFDGEEAAFTNLPLGAVVAANVALFAKTVSLVVSEKTFDALTDEQRDVLRTAAREMVRQASNHPMLKALGFEGVNARQWCRMRTGSAYAALATPHQLAELRAAARPVYTKLEHEPRTRKLIARIRGLKASLPPEPQMRLPASCLRPRGAPPAAGAPRSPSIVNGTYRSVRTRAEAESFGPPANNAGNPFPSVFTWVLRDGTWRTPGPDDDHGTYRIVGSHIVFDWPRVGYSLHFTFTRDRDGTLHLKPEPVPKMDRGDQFVMSAGPWRRVGPPLPSGAGR